MQHLSFFFVVAFLCLLIIACFQRDGGPSAPTVAPLTAKQLNNTSDDALEQLIIDHIFVLIGNDWEHEYQIVTGLSRGYRMIYATWQIERLSRSWGPSFALRTSSGRYAVEALDGYRLIGAGQHADLLLRLIAFDYNGAPTQTKYPVREDIETFAKSYKEMDSSTLDSEYFKLTEKLSALRVQYIREHIEEFTGR